MAQIQGGPAIPVSVVTGGKIKGGKAIPVYGYPSTPTDGRRAAAGPARPVYVVSDAQMAAGTFQLEGGPALPMYVSPSGLSVVGDAAQPVYVVGGSLGGAANPLASVPWVAQWKFNNNGNDSIGSNTLTNNNSATFTTGKLGGATGATQLVAASSQYWSVTSSAVASGNYDYYIAAWVYLDSTGSEMAIASDNYPNMIFRYSGNRFQFFWGSNFAATADSFGAPSTGTWYFVEGFRDGTQNKVYVCVNRGTTDSISNSDVPSGGSTFYIGRRSGANYWNGRIDNVAIARSSVGGGAILTTAQRDALYNGGNGTETLT